ncbi:hypothetical protein [Jeotgalibacillus malaysiensis]|uniref:hypothetical protein n=1 Tax=Jeotgalibacillus malaysiensis TaxID=1508404 RepID=UPI00384E6E5F
MFKFKKIAISLSVALTLIVSFGAFSTDLSGESVHFASNDEFSTMDRDRIVKPPA